MADNKKDVLADARKESDADTQAYYDRINGSQPTPTQEENDRAKLGFDSLKQLDDKDADGTEDAAAKVPAKGK